ncbi:hypothetical protein [Pseudoduganella violacea]|uniref:Lipoprotein n=1 Tax=Pseudoduganella violacea TaxID=1715466 RepID=A0A7W5BA07_9BURK|nr:hypothetical protein [Pseudoduganella violacea]MBB3119263.1 hypothetical protein [Pseudoduganella violacea]
MKRIYCVLGSCILAGCAAKPELVYHKIDSGTPAAYKENIADSYYRNASVVSVSVQEPKDPQKPGPLTYVIASTPTEARDFKIGIEPVNNLLNTTKITITKPENSERYASGGSETKDNLKDTITAVGGLVAKAVAMAAPSSQPQAAGADSCSAKLGEVATVDLSAALMKKASQSFTARFDKADPASACIKVELQGVPLDAIPVDDYPWGKKTSAYFYSACRSATITVSYPDKSRQPLVKIVRVADPGFLQYVHYPFKGVITMHSECGVSVKTDGTADPLAGVAAMTELLKQAEAIKGANK